MKLLGGCLIAGGILVAGTTGLCALLILPEATGSSLLSTIPFLLLPAAIGAGLIVSGRRLIRTDRDED